LWKLKIGKRSSMDDGPQGPNPNELDLTEMRKEKLKEKEGRENNHLTF
jgi:hypothetical protein